MTTKKQNAPRTVLNPGEEGYEEYITITEKLRQHRAAMHVLWRRREELLLAAGRPAASYMPMPRITPAQGVPVLHPVSAFNQVAAGAPRAEAPKASATTGDLAGKVRMVFMTHPGTVYTATTMATAVGVGGALSRPVGEAIKALVREKFVTEVKRNKFARLVLQEAAPVGA